MTNVLHSLNRYRLLSPTAGTSGRRRAASSSRIIPAALPVARVRYAPASAICVHAVPGADAAARVDNWTITTRN